jgi:AmpD protein
MNIINGWLDAALKVPSPNYNERPNGGPVDLLVVHNISLPPNEFGTPYIELFFQNKLPTEAHPYFRQLEGVEVSAHFLVKRCGTIIQFVSCDHRAWHAGQSSFCEQENCNDFSIGIELEGSDAVPFEALQYKQLSRLTAAVQNQFPLITKCRITGHEDIAPGRKTDPGPFFDWQSYLASVN